MTRWAILLVACGRVDFDAAPRRCDWTSGPRLGAVVERVELDTPLLESDIHLAHGDPNALYFARSPTSGNYDVFVAHRASEHDAFDPPTPVPALDNPATADLGLDVLADGTAYIARAPNGANTSLYELDASFAVVRELGELDDGLSKYNPFATDDQLSLWFTTDRANSDEDILVATRSQPGDPWTTTPFVFDSAVREGSPSLTADQLLVVWNALDASGDSDIYYATRRSTSDPWQGPSLLGPGVVSTTDGEASPYVREDGCELFFTRFTSGTPYDWNIYSVPIE